MIVNCLQKGEEEEQEGKVGKKVNDNVYTNLNKEEANKKNEGYLHEKRNEANLMMQKGCMQMMRLP